MLTIGNGLIRRSFYNFLDWFLATTIYAGSCKGPPASNRNKLLPLTIENVLKKSEKNDVTETHKENELIFPDSSACLKNVQDESYTDNDSYKEKKLPIPIENNQPVQPSFLLQDTIVQPGTTQTLLLQVVNPLEGYIIKSVSITKNTTTSYTNHFGLDKIKNQPIPSSGIVFTLHARPNLKPDNYKLKLRVGKTGKGSKMTEQTVCCTLTVVRSPQEKQTSLSHIQVQNPLQNSVVHLSNNETTQLLPSLVRSNKIKQKQENILPSPSNMGKLLIDKEIQTKNSFHSKKTNNTQTNSRSNKNKLNSTPPTFKLSDMTVQAGNMYNTILETDKKNGTEDYVLKCISVNKNTSTPYAKHFGLDKLKNKPIPASGLPFIVAPKETIKPGNYFLNFKVARVGSSGKRTQQKISSIITVK